MSSQIPWWRPEVGEEEIARVSAVMRTNYLNEGNLTEEFEKQVARLIGAKHGVAVTSGTSALFLSLKALGIGPGDEVIVPDITFIATANAVTMAGAKPVLADVDEKSLCLCPESFESLITPRTRAVIPVHVSGRGGTLSEILRVAERRNIPVVEDAAEALLSRHRGEYLGTLGVAGCFSFSQNKTITTGQGGMIVTDSDELHLKLRQLKDQGRPVRGTGGDDAHPVVGYNFKMTNVQAAIGLAQMERLTGRLERQRAIHRVYSNRLKGLAGVRVIPFDLEGGETPQWTDVLAERRNDLDAFLAARGMQCRRYWHPIHTQPPYQNQPAALTRSSAVSAKALWLPSAFQLDDKSVERVADTIREFYR